MSICPEPLTVQYIQFQPCPFFSGGAPGPKEEENKGEHCLMGYFFKYCACIHWLVTSAAPDAKPDLSTKKTVIQPAPESLAMTKDGSLQATTGEAGFLLFLLLE